MRTFFSSGLVLDRLTLVGPQIRLERAVDGWNIGKLVKAQRREADRRGPGRPISMPAIDIQGGTVTIDDRIGSTTYRLPQRVDDLNAKLSFEYAPCPLHPRSRSRQLPRVVTAIDDAEPDRDRVGA